MSWGWISRPSYPLWCDLIKSKAHISNFTRPPPNTLSSGIQNVLAPSINNPQPRKPFAQGFNFVPQSQWSWSKRPQKKRPCTLWTTFKLKYKQLSLQAKTSCLTRKDSPILSSKSYIFTISSNKNKNKKISLLSLIKILL